MNYELMDGAGTGDGEGNGYNGIRYSRQLATQFYHFPLLIKKGKLYMVLDYRMIIY